MTLTELQALSPDELRVRVAELMGWNLYSPVNYVPEDPELGPLPKGLYGWTIGRDLPECLPNYPVSLDSCREFEDAMSFSERRLYVVNLQRVMSAPLNTPAMVHPSACIFATPLQKCQAYILTKGGQ